MPSNARILIVCGLLKVIRTWLWLLLEINQIWWRRGRWRQRQVLHFFLSLLFTMFGALFTLLWPCQTLASVSFPVGNKQYIFLYPYWDCQSKCFSLILLVLNMLWCSSWFWIFKKKESKRKAFVILNETFVAHYNDAGSPSIRSGEWSFFHGNLCEDCNKCQWYILWNR